MSGEHPLYSLASLTDAQWDKQLESQEKLRLAEIESTRQVEMERLHNDRSARQSRSSLVGNVLAGLAALLVVLAVIASMYLGIARSSQEQHERAVECIKSQGRWIEGDSGDGDRCDRP